MVGSGDVEEWASSVDWSHRRAPLVEIRYVEIPVVKTSMDKGYEKTIQNKGQW
jgi:hypothetical protein